MYSFQPYIYLNKVTRSDHALFCDELVGEKNEVQSIKTAALPPPPCLTPSTLIKFAPGVSGS